MKYLVGNYYNGSFGTGTTEHYKIYKARNKHDAERMYQYEFGYLGGVLCSVFRNKCLFLNKEIKINSRELCNIILRSLNKNEDTQYIQT